ncbi:LOW QUALITY PROTEIN: voltage-dependent calcium channel gamma-6 subunit-like [Scyliorhinus torazame]|uniref:LOW QUALITY PROTEIN: voltage-dependent calcium channel gamma-6 subunit-like n=1 Tax=Scyliorhinus torazame TaxID=75743 RepID=UPI003B58D460
MSDSKEGSIKLTFFVALVGLTLMVLAVGTDFWAELNGRADSNATCLAAYFGVWRHCLRTIETLDVEPGRESCGPVELPGVSSCSYFPFFTSAENAKIMDGEVEKYHFIILAVLVLLSLCLMILGSLSITMALNRYRDFLIKLSASFFILAGLLVLASILTFQSACAALLGSEGLRPVEFAYMWSLFCAAAAAAIVVFAGVCFLLVAYPGGIRRVLGLCRKKGAGA